MAESDRIIAFAIIDAITDDGLLGISINDICATLAQNHQGADAPPTEDEVCEILQRIQRFDPVGVGARDLRECLLIQLDQLDEATPWLKEAKLLVDQFLALLGSKDFAALVRQTPAHGTRTQPSGCAHKNATTQTLARAAAGPSRLRGSRRTRA